MFARNVSINLRPNTLSEFLKTMEDEIVPLLRKQKGFQDEMTLSVPGGIEVVAVSFWDQKESAQGYDSSGYPKVLKILDKFLDRVPHVGTFEVAGSTFQERTAVGKKIDIDMRCTLARKVTYGRGSIPTD